MVFEMYIMSYLLIIGMYVKYGSGLVCYVDVWYVEVVMGLLFYFENDLFDVKLVLKWLFVLFVSMDF